MNFLKKLDILMDAQSLNKHSLSQKCGIPYTTIDAFYKKGYSNIKISTIQKLADFFDTSLDYLIRDEIVDLKYGKEHPPTSSVEPAVDISEEAAIVAHAYDKAETIYERNMARMALHLAPIEGTAPTKLLQSHPDSETATELSPSIEAKIAAYREELKSEEKGMEESEAIQIRKGA